MISVVDIYDSNLLRSNLGRILSGDLGHFERAHDSLLRHK